MDGKFIRVYRLTPDRRRVMFVWKLSPRLKLEPLSLAAFCIFNPASSEYQSYLFTEAYNCDLRRELSSFVNHACAFEEFSHIAKLSMDSFIAICKELNFPEFTEVSIDRLF